MDLTSNSYPKTIRIRHIKPLLNYYEKPPEP